MNHQLKKWIERECIKGENAMEKVEEYGTDWKNVDLNSGYTRDLSILDKYSFEALLLEINCKLKVINKETVKKLYSDMVWNKIDSANKVFGSNLDNIVKYANDYRKEA